MVFMQKFIPVPGGGLHRKGETVAQVLPDGQKTTFTEVMEDGKFGSPTGQPVGSGQLLAKGEV